LPLASGISQCLKDKDDASGGFSVVVVRCFEFHSDLATDVWLTGTASHPSHISLCHLNQKVLLH